MVALGKTSNPALLVAREEQARAQQLGKLFEDHAEFVWRSLRRLGVDHADLEDALQEVFVVVHRRIADYEERSSLRAWLYAICIRVNSKHRRSRGRRREDVLDELPEVTVEPDQESGVEQQQSLRLGQRLLEALPEKQRMVFVLYEVEHMSMAEIAEIVGCPIQTAYARLHKARERVRSELARQRMLGRCST
jgi:RNA polymerase sigma-70 factor (ECF subfamily)